MITELVPNKTYFQGNTQYPFFSKRMCTGVNTDGTFNTNESKRYATVNLALSHWCQTKDEAVLDMVQYFLSFDKDKLSGKAQIYKDFYYAMEEYSAEHYPELFL